jgi:hypothetical protein
MNPIAPQHPDDRVDPAWYALALRAAFRADRAAGVLEDYEFSTEDRTFTSASETVTSRRARAPRQHPRSCSPPA